MKYYLLIPFLPLAAFLINILLGKEVLRDKAHWPSILAVVGAWLVTIFNVLPQVMAGKIINEDLYTWIASGTFNVSVGFLIDPLTAVMLVVVTTCASLIHIYAVGYMHGDSGYYRFFAYMSLFTFCMLMLVMGNNFLQLYFGWEGVGLCSYFLIGYYFNKKSAADAGKKAFIVNRIGAPNQALISAILDDGKIKTDSIDTIMKAMAGMPMGPFELADYVGIDVFYHTLKYYSETLSPEFKPGKVLQNMLDSGKLGMKTGQGIYTWEGGKAKIDASEQSKDIGPMEFLAIQINEAVRVYKEKIAASTADIDLGMVHCMRAFAGPFALGAGMDPQQMADTLNKLYQRFGLKIFKPEPEIVDGSFKTMK